MGKINGTISEIMKCKETETNLELLKLMIKPEEKIFKILEIARIVDEYKQCVMKKIR